MKRVQEQRHRWNKENSKDGDRNRNREREREECTDGTTAARVGNARGAW